MASLRGPRRAITCTPRDTRSWRARVRTPGAFSLVELVIVVLVFAVLSAIAVPRFTASAARARVAGAADLVAGQIVLTRDRARAASGAHRLRVARGSGAVTMVGPDDAVLGAFDLGAEPYLAVVTRTDLPGGEVEFSGYALPTSAGRIMLRSSGHLAIVSIAHDGTVSVSGVAPERSPDPSIADVAAQLGSNLRARDVVATPGNAIRSTAVEDKAK